MTPKERLKKEMDELLKKKDNETIDEFLDRMEKDLDEFTDDYKKLDKINNKT